MFEVFSKSVFRRFHYARDLWGACPIIFVKLDTGAKPTPEAMGKDFVFFKKNGKVHVLNYGPNVDRNPTRVFGYLNWVFGYLDWVFGYLD